jgi:hypothetical protein
MSQNQYLFNHIDLWESEGLISHEQAENMKQHETMPQTRQRERRVQTDEIFVYLGSLVILLALTFLVVLNWATLTGIGRILTVFVPTAAMLGLGERLRPRAEAKFRRGAQALWLGGCLLTAVTFAVIFNETVTIDWQRYAIGDPWVWLSCLLATIVAALAFWRLSTVTQSVALHISGTAVMLSSINWLIISLPDQLSQFQESLVVLILSLVFGGLWLVLAAWLQPRMSSGIVRVSRLFGALTILLTTFSTAVLDYPLVWQWVVMVFIALLASIAFLAASVWQQSRTFLYSGAAFLLFIITQITLEHFADKIGVPVALFVMGVLLIGLGLGTERLHKRIQHTH